MVGRAAVIRWLLDILPFAKGTLKSTLRRCSECYAHASPAQIVIIVSQVPDKDALSLEVDVLNAKFVAQRHCSKEWWSAKVQSDCVARWKRKWVRIGLIRESIVLLPSHLNLTKD